MDRTCPSCESALPVPSRFCPSCGSALTEIPPIYDAPVVAQVARDRTAIKIGMCIIGALMIVAGLLLTRGALDNLSLDGFLTAFGLMGGGGGLLIAAIATRTQAPAPASYRRTMPPADGAVPPAAPRTAPIDAEPVAKALAGTLAGIAGGVMMALVFVAVAVVGGVMLLLYTCNQLLGNS